MTDTNREYYVPDLRYERYLTRIGQLSFLTAESDKVYVESQGRNILFILLIRLMLAPEHFAVVILRCCHP